MKYALGNMLNGYGVRALDPDAKAYIDAVVAAGATVTSTQRNAINTFVKTGKTDGWYSSLKRLYLPIWGVESPNEIDMIGRTSGTFSGGVTHASGYVQGNGSTGRFAYDTSWASLGLSASSGLLIAGRKNVVTGRQIMGATANGRAYLIGGVGGVARTEWIGSSSTYNTSNTGFDSNGILIFSRFSGQNHYHHRSSAATINENTAYANTGTLLAAQESVMVVSTVYDSSEYLFYGVGLGISAANLPKLSLALKNLWESATGLTLEGAEYISALRSAGATVTSTQESAIHTFIRTGKTDGWWSSLKRLYLPIWNIEAPNAIDMVTRTSGTFVGTVNRSAGYVRTDGSTGYFNTGVTLSAAGCLQDSTALFAMTRFSGSLLNTQRFLGGQDSSNNTRAWIERYGSGAGPNSGTSLGSATDNDNRYFFIRSRTGSAARYNGRYRNGTYETRASDTAASQGIMTVQNMVVMAVNANGTIQDFASSSMDFCAYGFGLGVSEAQAAKLGAATQTLWETCTGLTLT